MAGPDSAGGSSQLLLHFCTVGIVSNRSRLSPGSLRPSSSLRQCSGATPQALCQPGVGPRGDLWITGVGVGGTEAEPFFQDSKQVPHVSQGLPGKGHRDMNGFASPTHPVLAGP